ncbi:hypothetical protein RJ639_000705 [Escallonia herrerae]|uniref:Uncharacterized protein n=1 Tax=Escallonia herrerae TaxID=1293975 RepID=A0AA88X7P5_9ASTE|nr:hypothetical protein RJ639_000705 [Escallonia herrerae]
MWPKQHQLRDILEMLEHATLNDKNMNAVFRDLIYFVEEEYGLPMSGPITVPCDASFMECAVSIVRRHPVKDMDKALEIAARLFCTMKGYSSNSVPKLFLLKLFRTTTRAATMAQSGLTAITLVPTK